MRFVLYPAAHGGFARERVPLGGGAAVFEHLVDEWSRTTPFELKPVTPAILGDNAPTGGEVVRYGEAAYAAFSRAFERASTQTILRFDPKGVVVLINDISEGPDFERLGRMGYRMFTIYHVDVVAYVASMYLRGLVQPETTVRWYRRLRPLLPDMAALVWDKQEASVRWSRGLIVPSAGMKDVLLRCYPACPPEKIHVLPWGSWGPSESDLDATLAREGGDSLRQEFGVPVEAQVLLTLSRISPEKGQHGLLEALLAWEGRPDYPKPPLWVFICGDAAFMQGRRYLDRLRTLAGRLKRTKVVFPGYVTGERKQAFFAMADVYVFPSRHESYGLTLLEALGAGLPAVCSDSLGARSVMRPEFGALVSGRDEMLAAIARLLADADGRRNMGEAARRFAAGERFSDRAAELAKLLML